MSLVNAVLINVFIHCCVSVLYTILQCILWDNGVCVGFLLSAAQRRLEELQSEIGDAEQQMLKVTGELQQLEDALAQKKVSYSTKSKGRCLKRC